MSENVNESLHEPTGGITEPGSVNSVTPPGLKTPERLHFAQENGEMSQIERLALALSVWLVLVCAVVLLGWLKWV